MTNNDRATTQEDKHGPLANAKAPLESTNNSHQKADKPETATTSKEHKKPLEESKDKDDSTTTSIPQNQNQGTAQEEP